MYFDFSERQKLINEVAEAELAAKRLKNLLKELTKYSKKREHNRALSKIELVPHEFEPIEVIDLSDIGDPDTYEVADRFVDKRSKNFMKLVNQAARGFGRK